MGLTSNIKDNDPVSIRQAIAKMGSLKLGPTSSPTFANIVTDDLTTDEITLINTIDEFSTDGTLSGNSDSAVPTEKAVKTYVDESGGGLIGVIHDCGTSNVSLDEDISFGGGYSL